jgi:hypothetical protein
MTKRHSLLGELVLQTRQLAPVKEHLLDAPIIAQPGPPRGGLR